MTVSTSRIDCHQHLWPTDFLRVLRERTTLPRLVDDWTLLVAGEAPYSVNPAAHDVEKRRLQEVTEGSEEVLISLPGALAIEDLPFDEATSLIRVWHESAIALGAPYRVWAATPLVEFDLDGLTAILRNDRIVGLQIPAPSIGDAAALARMRPVLDVVGASGKPVLVHPRPLPPAPAEPTSEQTAVESTVVAPMSADAQLQAAWKTWNEGGARQHPDLRIGFVALAGLAPLVQQRAAVRGGVPVASDANVFYETSTYDKRAISAMARLVGIKMLLHGSDRPYKHPRDPELGRASEHALFAVNPRAFLSGPASR